MNIYEEYERLKNFVKLPGGWDKIDEIWMVASGYRKNPEGQWLKKEVGQGRGCTSVAIDLKTWATMSGYVGCNHEWARFELIRKLRENIESEEEWDEIERRVWTIYLIESADWKYPLVMIYRFSDFTLDELTILEEKILSLEIGLPMARLFIEKDKAIKKNDAK